MANQPPHKKRLAQPTSPYRLGIIGLGDIAKAHVDALRQIPGFTIAAVCDTDPARAQTWARSLDCQPFTKSETFFSADLDVVALLLPHHLHAPMAIDAMRAGLHVMVEKPMATSPDDCQMMMRVAEETDRMLMVADTSEYVPGAVETGRRYQDGSLGKFLTGSTLTVREYFHADRPTWFLDPTRSGGGMFANVGVHRLAVTRTALPGVLPDEVTAVVQQPEGFPVEACATVLIRYTHGAAMQYQEIGHLPTPTWLNTGTYYLFENGMVGWDTDRWYFNPTKDQGQAISQPLPPEQGYQPIYENLYRCLIGETCLESQTGPAQDVAIVAAAYHSAKNGQTVSINTIAQSQAKTPEKSSSWPPHEPSACR